MKVPQSGSRRVNDIQKKKISARALNKNRKGLHLLVILALIVILGVALRVYDLGRKSLWTDEVASVRDSKSIASMTRSAQPPLYYFVLYLFRYMGTNEVILRLPSVVFGILTIALVYKVGKVFFGAKEGLVGAFLLSISTFHVYYSQEARMYTLLGFLSLLSLFFFYKSIKENKNTFWFAFVLSTILTLYTHYFGVFIFFVEILFFILMLIRNGLLSKKMRAPTRFARFGKRTFLMFTLSATIILALYVPFFYSRFGIPSALAESEPLNSLPPPLELSFLVKLFGQLSNGSPFGYSGVALYLSIFFFLCGWILYMKKYKEKSALLLLWIIVPIILLFWVSTIPFIVKRTRVYAEPRYLIFVLPVYLLLISMGITSIAETVVSKGASSMRAHARKRRKKNLNISLIAPLLIVIVLGVTSVGPLLQYYRGEKRDWRAVAQYLEIETQANDVIVIEPSYLRLPFSYYFKNQKNITVKSTYGSVSTLENIYHRNSRIWFVTSPSKKIAEVIDWVDQNSLWSKRFGGGLRTYFISRSPLMQFKAAVFTNTDLSKSYISWWNTTLASVGASTTIFDDTTILSNVDLSEFDLVLFVDIKRPLDDTERLYLQESIRNGATVVVSGLSPYWIAGGTTDLTSISTWFGATVFSEAPREARWKVKFTEPATEVMGDLDLNAEYAFYTNSDWSTPTATLAQSDSVVYAYRVNDEAATVFSHEFGNGTVVFNGVRFGFASPDADVSQRFLQALIQSVIG